MRQTIGYKGRVAPGSDPRRDPALILRTPLDFRSLVAALFTIWVVP
jgi:hypothetical protein